MADYNTYESRNVAGFDLRIYDQVASTNDIAKSYGRNGQYNIAVLAAQQTQGRGRSGNDWVSPKGNLYLSFVIPEKIALKDAGQLSFVTAVALFETLSNYTHSALQQKWPNDLFLNGKKLSGILLESEAVDGKTEWVVIGTGVNIAAAPEGAAMLEQKVKPQELAEAFLSDFKKWLEIWRRDGFAPVRAEWLKNARGLGQQITVRLPNETKTGIFDTIDDSGCLLLKQDNETIKIASGDVFFN